LTARRIVSSIMSASAKSPPQSSPVLDLTPGELVRVRSASEIFATLDDRGTLDGLPFMPEMLKYCGRTLPVGQRADTTCAGAGDARRMLNAVHLQRLRCDGSAHDGCQAACLMFWKEAWLERVDKRGAHAPRPLDEDEARYVGDTLLPATKVTAAPDATATLYRCQATEIPKASEPLRFRDVGQYVRAFRSWRPAKVVKNFVIEVFILYQSWSRRHLPERLRISGGRPYPFMDGPLDKGECPPSGQLDLRPGDLVRIKSRDEIVATLQKGLFHRGLSFDGEMAKFCGQTARVKARVNHIVDEKTGKMIDIKSDCIILDGVVCTSAYHRLCTRAIYSYWRELWLEKIESPAEVEPTAPCVNRRSRG
jgi:hypothetical protein